jgi:predicted nucleotidyltransferase
MKPSEVLGANRDAVRAVVLAHRATNPRIFGSVARGEDAVGSDLDLLIDPTSDTTLFDIGAIRQELLDLLGVPVDLVTPKSLPVAFRDRVLAEAVPV